jgi:hypothetical protein
MISVFFADSIPEERSALHLGLLGLKMEVVGEAAYGSAMVAQVQFSRTDMLLVNWDLLIGVPGAVLETHATAAVTIEFPRSWLTR